jgi:hypothetical protein
LGTRAKTWEQTFPYRGGEVVVTRLQNHWRVCLGGKVAEAKTVVEAFEGLLGQHAGDPELQIVLAALAASA